MYSYSDLRDGCILIFLVFNVMKFGNKYYALILDDKVGDCSRGQPKGSLFNRYNNEVKGRVLLHFTPNTYFIMLSVKKGDMK